MVNLRFGLVIIEITYDVPDTTIECLCSESERPHLRDSFLAKQHILMTVGLAQYRGISGILPSKSMKNAYARHDYNLA